MAKKNAAKKSTKIEPISTANKGGDLATSSPSGATYPSFSADMGQGLPPQEAPKKEK